MDTRWSKITNMEYLCTYWVHWVEILQGWSTTRTTHCDSGYDVTIATHSLADLYLPKMKNAFFFPPESYRLSCACAVWCHIGSHSLNEQHKQVTLLQGGKLWVYFLNEEGVEPIVLPWKCHSGHINFVITVTTVQSFSSMQKKYSEIFHFLCL